MKPRTYYIPRIDDHDLAPEETLVDALSGHSIVESPISRRVFKVFFFCACVLTMVLLVQAFRLQIMHGKRFAVLASQNRANAYSIPALRGVIFDATGIPLVENVPVFDLVAVRSQLAKSGDSRYSDILEQNKDNGVFVIQHDITKNEAIRVQAENIPGLYVVPYARRQYDGGAAFAHILGYTAPITPDEVKKDSDHRYQLNDQVGRLGIESSYEKQLHGDPQEIILEGNTTTQTASARSGEDVTLYLRSDVQNELYNDVSEVFRLAGVRRGAAIVQNVHTGEVLGLVSMPTFDPNGDISKILSDSQKPLFNRVTSGLYSPGSTIKPLYALAGLKEKIVTPDTTIYADGAIQVQSEVDPMVFYTFRDWKVHGWTDIRKAIAWSVDVYFYALGGSYQDIHGLGVDRIVKYLKLFHADEKTGIDLPSEQAGFVPTREWKKEKKNDAWYVGDTYNISIGQGDLLVTPLWLNMYVSAIANGGNLMKPIVAKNESPQVLSHLPFDQETYQVVREGMRQTVTDGTAERLKDLPFPVAAKTGTAQVGDKALNSLFIVYGPYDNPEIAMTILVENIPQSQSLGVDIAKRFFIWYFQSDIINIKP